MVEEANACVDIDCLRGRCLSGMVRVVAVDKRVRFGCGWQGTAVQAQSNLYFGLIGVAVQDCRPCHVFCLRLTSVGPIIHELCDFLGFLRSGQRVTVDELGNSERGDQNLTQSTHLRP
jgi:hypothetical protein